MRDAIGKLSAPAAKKWGRRIFLLLYFAEAAAILGMLLWKSRYGFGDADESFYLATPLRFLRGDRMLLDEWHLSQFASFTMIPEMWVYLLLSPSTEGMILTFRIAFAVLWSAGSLFLYFRARSIHEFGARCASLFLQCYAPFGIMAFSYNSLGILYLVNSAVFLLCARRAKRLQFALSGVFFAGAVLCCPYLALVYLLYSLALLCAALRKKNPVIPTNGTEARVCWTYFTAGAALLAALFLAALLRGGSPRDLLASLSHALTDAEHNEFSVLGKTGDYFGRMGDSNAFFLPCAGAILLMIPVTLRWRRLSGLWLGMVCAAAAVYLRRFLQEYAYPNYLMFPATLIGLYVLAVTRRPLTRWVGGLWLVPGVLYSYCLNFSSNQYFYAVSSACSVSSVAAFLMMWLYAEELRDAARAEDGEGSGHPAARVFARRGGALALFAVLAFFAVQMRYEIPIRVQTVYWEPGLMEYEEQAEMDEGPEKGIIATAKKAKKYRRLYQDVRQLNHQRTLFLSEQIWMYLVNENENAAYSGWLWRVNSYAMNRLKEYYATRPGKEPEVIFLEKEFKKMLKYFDPEDFRIEKLESGNYLITPLSPGAGWDA